MRKILLKIPVREATGMSDTTIWREEKAGRFPRRVQLTPNRVGWYEDEIEAWIESRQRGPAEVPENFKKNSVPGRNDQ